MNYYLLTNDDAVKNAFRLSSYTQKHSRSFEDIVIQEELLPNVKMVDYVKKLFLLESRHIVSDKVKEVLDTCRNVFESRAIFVTGGQEQCVYWEVKIPLIDCITNRACKRIEDIVLDERELKQHDAFAVLFEQQEYLIFRFETAERVMQVFPLGIKFRPVQGKGEAL